MAIQWHPLFAQLLRPLVEGYYEVQTNVPVGDAPRQADLVLLRRTSQRKLPFVGLWRHLTTWNILEYKGPTVSARLEDLRLLVELGLGIHRRLNDERHKAKGKRVTPAEVSFWYLTRHVGGRFLKDAVRKLGPLETRGDGVWQGAILEHPLFVISGADLPVEMDSAPFHVLDLESADHGLAAARLVIHQPALWDWYSQFVGSLHPETLQELQAMARSKKEHPFHFKPMADLIGMNEVVNQLGVKEIVDAVGAKRFIEQFGADNLIGEVLNGLSPAKRAEVRRQIDKKDATK